MHARMQACFHECIFTWMHICVTHEVRWDHTSRLMSTNKPKPLLCRDWDSRYANTTLGPRISTTKYCHDSLYVFRISRGWQKHIHHIGGGGGPKDLIIISRHFVSFIDWFSHQRAPCMTLDLGTTQMHAYRHTYAHVHMCFSSHVHIHFFFHMCMYAHMHECIHACANIFMYVCLLTHVCISTH